MKLVPNWRRAWRMVSVQAMAVAAAIQGAWPLLDDAMRATLPPHLVHWLSVVLLVAGIAGRLVDQPKVRGE
jgi:hypothetical protein